MPGASVLIVDDDSAVQRFVCRCLGLAGIQARAASGVAEATEALRNGAFDLVLCDWRMPDGSGEDFLRHARAIDPGLPVIIMTGAVEEATQAALLQSGARAVLTKPVQLSLLIRHVREHARPRQASG